MLHGRPPVISGLKMRIDVSTNGIDTIQFGNADGQWLRASEAARTKPAADNTDPADPALRTDFADAIRKALQLQDEKAAAVEAAKKAIEQNTLDTPQNIQTAANNLLNYGI